MIPNENFHKYLPDEILPGEKARSSRSSCLRVGTWFIIRKIMQDYKLPELLGNYFNSKNIGPFLDLMCYSLICENNAGQYFPDYTYNHQVFTEGIKMYSDSKVSDFLNSLTDDQSIGFQNAWNENKKRSDRIYISYDSTNKNSQAGDLEIVEYGKAKKDLVCLYSIIRLLTIGTTANLSFTRNIQAVLSMSHSCSSCWRRPKDTGTGTSGSY